MAMVLLAAVTLAGPAYTPVDHYLSDWMGRVETEGAITVELVHEYRAFFALLAPPPPPSPTRPAARHGASPVRSHAPGVEQWRPLIEAHFQPADVPWAMRVMACESGGDPYAKNPRSTASGLFQFLRGWWSGAWGYPAFDPFDPEANVRAAAWLYYTDGPKHWVCK
jgi:hypothetical protein